MGDELRLSIVLDTNQLVSAILRQGSNSHSVLELALRNKVRLYYSHKILTEYIDVLYRPKFNFNHEVVKQLLGSITGKGIMVEPEVSSIILPDETDRKFYDAARMTGSVLITGNIKHYPAKDFIQSPATFLENFYKR
jgi:putative PIN family toxin of toxin-antitoxin system